MDRFDEYSCRGLSPFCFDSMFPQNTICIGVSGGHRIFDLGTKLHTTSVYKQKRTKKKTANNKNNKKKMEKHMEKKNKKASKTQTNDE